MKIVIDAMGGDNAPQATVEGAVQAINEYGIDIILTGDKEQIEKELEFLRTEKRTEKGGAARGGLSAFP